jgi:hypothetical protein
LGSKPTTNLRIIMTTPTPSPIQVGVRAPQATVASLAAKTAKVFYHAVPGANFIMPTGQVVVFLGGQFMTEDPAIIAELEAISDKPQSQIYTKKSLEDLGRAGDAKLAADAAVNAHVD